MKVVHVIASLDAGGAEAALYSLCFNSKKDVDNIVICLQSEGKYGPLLIADGIKVRTLGMSRGSFSFRSFIYLFRLIRQYKPDTVQTWMYHADLLGGLAAKFAGVKRIIWGVHNTNLIPGVNKRSTIFVSKVCSYLSYIVPSKIVCCANKSLQVHAEANYRKSIMTVINNGYDTNNFNFNQYQANIFLAEIGQLKKLPLLGCVGRFDPAKDHRNLLDALALLVQRGVAFRCCLVGNEMTQDNTLLAGLISALGLNEHVILLGLRSDIPAVMSALDIHILSSVAEAFPNVLCEAMACGTPCVTTDVGDAAIIVGDTGWVVPAKDAEKLADAIVASIECYRDSKSWEKRSADCRERIVSNFSVDKMVCSYLQVWNADV